MNAQWQKKLLSFGVSLDGDQVVFPDIPTDPGADVLCTLSSEAVMHVSGEDAEAFLQGQFSNDVAALAVPGSQLSTWSNPKGRVLCLFRLIRVDDGYLIRLPSELLESVQKRLKMYVLMAKVVIEHRDDLVAIGVSGEKGQSALSELVSQLPDTPDDSVKVSAGCWLTRVRGDSPRFELIGDVESLEPVWKACMDSCQMTDEAAWRLQNIDAGVPSVTSATSEAFVLQMMNLHHIDGVSFKKGCFPGQEVVARMQYLGKLKRQMYRLDYSGELKPSAGSEIYKEGGNSAVGKVVDAQLAGDAHYRMLAVIAIDATEAAMSLDQELQHKVSLLELPYSIAEAE